jgi:hypothetical protein
MYSNLAGNLANINVYPNPSHGVINLNIASSISNSQAVQNPAVLSYNIRILDVSGSVVKTATATQLSWQDNLSSLKAGTYIIQVVNNNDNKLVGKSTFVKL